MSVLPLPGLAIESEHVSPEQPNFRPDTLPPSDDWPVVIDGGGYTVSRWADSVWVLDSWAGKRCVLNFGDGASVGKNAPIDKRNANLLRIIAGWWLYGPNGVRSAATLLIRFNALRPLFALCSKEGIAASDLVRYPLLADKLHTVFMPSASELILSMLHELLAHANEIGFELLGRNGLARLAAALPENNHQQTLYIPPRIWKYQVTRLRECIDDFLHARADLESLYNYCLDAYVQNYGSLEEATRVGKTSNLRPFISRDDRKPPNDRLQLGTFDSTAKAYGVAGLLNKWVGTATGDGFKPLAIDQLSSYFTLVSWVSIGYILNFTLMRIDEAVSLEKGCLSHDDDPRFGRIFLIVGETSKTIKDRTAHWVTSESSGVAVEALEVVARLRSLCRTGYGHGRLMHAVTEPWACGARPKNGVNRPWALPYASVSKRFPALFDVESLRITARDLELARLATPTIAANIKEGSIWPLAWHQLRRTGAVNMQASGLVSEASLQFQLKHLSRAMSLYYGQNHTRVRLEETSRATYVLAMYESLGRELQALASERFVSPHGPRRKGEVIRLISVDDLKQTIRLARQGGVACREIVLGACMNVEPCAFGGVESVAHCGGGNSGKPCVDVLYDKSKVQQVERLDRLLDERLARAPRGSPLHESLNAQKHSIQNYFSAVNLKD